VLNMVFGKRVFFCHVVSPKDGRVWWFANPARKTEPTASELATLAGEKLRADLLDLVARDRTPATEIIRATRDVYPAWPTFDFPTVPVWHRGRMVIIGDAAHATSPAAGQGASMAIEDAVTLGKCLRDVPDIERALSTYESLRRERVEAVVAAGKRNGDNKVIGPVGRVVRDFFLKRIFSKPFDEDPNAFMWQHRIDWDEKISA
jgi:FAD-dependent urate hydroxylase